jgi:hypothetical protein
MRKQSRIHTVVIAGGHHGRVLRQIFAKCMTGVPLRRVRELLEKADYLILINQSPSGKGALTQEDPALLDGSPYNIQRLLAQAGHGRRIPKMDVKHTL